MDRAACQTDVRERNMSQYLHITLPTAQILELSCPSRKVYVFHRVHIRPTIAWRIIEMVFNLPSRGGHDVLLTTYSELPLQSFP